MPKYAVHAITMEKAAEKLPAYGGTQQADILLGHRNLAVTGALGPDIFFWAPDYTICQVLLKIFEAWDSLVKIYDESVISDIADAINEIKAAVGDALEATIGPSYDLIMKVVEEFRETTSLFEETIKYGALSMAVGVDNLIADAGDLPTVTHRIFDMFKPPLQDKKPEDDWYWFDMLHYRYVGDFAGNLLKNARQPEQKAYAYGYLTHIATDLVGHGYVNQIVGGPYRTHVQRHVAMESFLDTWALSNYKNKNIATDLVNYLDLPDSLPGEVVDMLYSAFLNAYQGKPHPHLLGGEGFLSRDDIVTTYSLFKRITTLMESRIKKPEEPFSEVMQILEDALRDFSPPPSPPDIFEGDCSVWDFLSFGITEKSRDCYKQAVEAIGEFFEYLGELLEWTFESIKQIFQFLLALPTTAIVAVVLGLLYIIQLSIYKVLSSIRDYLALSGILYPSIEMVYTAHGRNLLLPCVCGISDDFPHTYYSGSCLMCPDSPIELPQTIPSWYRVIIEGNSASEAQVKALMQTLISGVIETRPLNLQALGAYAAAASPEATRGLYLSLGGGSAGKPQQGNPSEIGSAADVAAWMITNQDNPITLTNWNLDSDRGYAYKQWAGTLPTSPNRNITNERYI